MIISNILKTASLLHTTLSADITFRGQKTERMYFSVKKEFEDFLYTDASPFLAAVVVPCMKRGEQIIVKGSVSPKLLQGIKKIMNVYENWNVGLNEVPITVQQESKDMSSSRFTGCFFSAGVDSFHTYLQHSGKKKDGITHLILVHGFDIDLKNTHLFNSVSKSIQKVANEEGIQLITIQTNAAEIIEPRIIWDWGHGGALAAVALLLRKKINTVYISGAVKFDELFPYGTHPDLDTHWSTEKLQIVHEGSQYSRLEKILHSISKSPLALKYLRVCTQNRKGKYNCSHCFKCLRTMTELICANALDKCKTFNKKINIHEVSNMYYDPTARYDVTAKSVLDFLKKQNREPELQKAIAYSLQQSKRFSLKRKISQLIAYIDQNYLERRIYKFVFTISTEQDRNVYFKFLARVGLIK